MMENENGRWNRVGEIWDIIDRLRGESGCPWDRKQTPESVQTYLIEEAHEAAAAVRSGEIQEAAEELGDVLFMVLFLIHLYEEQGIFKVEDVCELICSKMIRRHPHVFGETTVQSIQEVWDNWEKIKAREKGAAEKPPGGIPESLPALVRAYRTLSRFARGKDSPWNDPKGALEDLDQKSDELRKRMESGETLRPEVFGELLLNVVNLARLQGYRAEDCLHESLRPLMKTP